MKPYIVAIDNDGGFLARIEERLNNEGVLAEKNLHKIFLTEATPHEAINKCTTQVNNLISRGAVIDVIFVDVVIIEKAADDNYPQELDMTGLDIAQHLRTIVPSVPIIGVTRFHKDYPLLVELSLSKEIDGFVPKVIIENRKYDFSKSRLYELISKAKQKSILYLPKQEKVFPINPSEIQSNFQFQDDPRFNAQISEIGEWTLKLLLNEFFPSGEGTVFFMRSGFSGSFLFKVSVKNTDTNISPGLVKTWVLKVTNSEDDASEELQKHSLLKSRIDNTLYPALLKEELVTINNWHALAFEMIENANPLSQFIEESFDAPNLPSIVRQLQNFLRGHYGEPQCTQVFPWRTYYSIDDKTKARLLYLIDDVKKIPQELTLLENNVLEKLQNFINDSKTIKGISDFAANVQTQYIHGDLNANNILVGYKDDKCKLIFIDFAKSVQDHFTKDIAKLETELVLTVMDNKKWCHTDWSRLTNWKRLEHIYKDKIFNLEYQEPDDEIKKIIGIILNIRNILLVFNDKVDCKEYLISLLFYMLKAISYMDITIQKKILAIHLINNILDLLT